MPPRDGWVASGVMELRVRTSSVATTTVVALDGTADLAAAPLLHATLQRATQQAGGGELVVDLDGLAVLDDAALGLLVGAAARQRESGGTFVVVCTSIRVLDRLAATRLDTILTIRSRVVAVGDPPA